MPEPASILNPFILGNRRQARRAFAKDPRLAALAQAGKIQPFWLRSTNATETLTASATVTVTFSHAPEEGLGGDLEITELHSMVNVPWSGRLYHQNIEDNYMNRAIHGSILGSVGAIPSLFRAPIYVQTNQGLRLEVTNLSAQAGTGRFYFFGWRFLDATEIPWIGDRITQWYEGGPRPFWLTTDAAVDPGASAAATENLMVPSNRWLHVLDLYDWSQGDYTATIRMSRSGRAISSDEVHNRVMFGPGGYPRHLPIPWVLAPRTILQLAVTDLSARANDIYVALHGIATKGTI